MYPYRQTKFAESVVRKSLLRQDLRFGVGTNSNHCPVPSVATNPAYVTESLQLSQMTGYRRRIHIQHRSQRTPRHARVIVYQL